jgi:prevent-host-death family protein
MREIGIRELKGSLSETLQAVGRGESIRVTNRGRAVADILPAGSADRRADLADLIAAGELTPPSRPRSTRPPRPAKGRKSATQVVLEERDAER